MTNDYDEECLQTFLDNQLQLFPEPVADSEGRGGILLEDCLAVFDNKSELLEYGRKYGYLWFVRGGSIRVTRSICTFKGTLFIS